MSDEEDLIRWRWRWWSIRETGDQNPPVPLAQQQRLGVRPKMPSAEVASHREGERQQEWTVASIISALAQSPIADQVWALDLSGLADAIDDGGLAPVAKLKQLRALSLDGCGNVADISPLTECHKVELVDLTSTGVSDEDCLVLSEMGSLQFLDVMGTDVTDRGLETLADSKLPLRGIALGSQPGVTDDGVSALLRAKQTSLELLALGDLDVRLGPTTQVTPRVLDSVSRLAHLRSLALGPKGFSALDLERLRAMHRLRYFYADLPEAAAGVELRLDGAERWRDLEVFYLRYVPPCLEAVEIADYEHLTEVTLANTSTHPIRSVVLRNLPMLWEVQEADGWNQVRSFEATGPLGLGPLPMSARAPLTRMSATGDCGPWAEEAAGYAETLRVLDYSGNTRLRDEDLAHLVALTNLETLDLRGCENLSDEAIAALALELPSTEVLWDE